MDIFGILKNLKENLNLKKFNNYDEKVIKEINVHEADLFKIKMKPSDDKRVYVIDGETDDKLLDEWFNQEGVDVDPDKTEELPPELVQPQGTDLLQPAGDLDSTLPLPVLPDEDLEKTLEAMPAIDSGFSQAGDLDDWEDGKQSDDSGVVVEEVPSNQGEWEDWELPNPDNYITPSSIPETGTIPFEPQLGTDSLGMFQAGFHTPDPIDVEDSILDMSVKELVGMPIQSIRTLLIDELEEAAEMSPDKRKAQLQKIFNHLIRIQPSKNMSSSNTEDYLNHEERLYIDIISTPEIYQMPLVREFLENDFYTSSSDYLKKRLLVDIYKYYDTHTPEAIEKFNYILRSSDSIGVTLMSEGIVLEEFFNERAMASFRKEDLSQLFRFYFSGEYDRKTLQTLFSEEHSKSLFMISQMTKKVNSITGHSPEFLESALEMFSNNFGYNGFVTLLEDIYDKVVGGPENEAKFANAFAATDDFVVMRELINFVVLRNYDSSVSIQLFNNATKLEDFLKGVEFYREENHRLVLGGSGLTKFKAGTFDPKTDFRAIESKKSLREFKDGMLYNIYGISYAEAEHLHEHYCRYMDALEEGIIEEDRPIFEMLKAIDSIYTLDRSDPDFIDKLRVLQEAYFKEISEKGLDHQKTTASAIIVEGLLNRMFMNTYNKRLIRATNESKIIGHDDGVTIIDAGLEFDMIVTSLSGVEDFYDHDVNMASKWNTAALSRGQGFCSSHLSSQNLGVISLSSPILGFNQIPQDGLNSMGTSDIFTSFRHYNLRTYNDSRKGSNRFFVPGNIMADETRYGYNEILLDRFLMSDPDGKLKIQPDYILFYKLDENYKNSVVYLQSKKMAEDFGIPIMMVDVPKIKQHEKATLLKMEDELFSEEFSEEKFDQIVTRYMNNYTGSLVFTFSNNSEDFSVGEMRRFFNKVIKHIDSIEDEELRQRWITALHTSYAKEQRRYDEAISAGGWHHSVSSFILDEKYNLGARIASIMAANGIDLGKTEELDPLEITAEPTKVNEHSLPSIHYEGTNYTFATSQSLPVESKAIIDFANYLDIGTHFDVKEYTYHDVEGILLKGKQSDDGETVVIENLVVSYLIGNYDEAPLEEVQYDLGRVTNMNFDSDISTNLKSSIYNMVFDKSEDTYIGLSKEKAELYIEKIEAMSEESFLKIFSPVIAAHSKRTEESYESIAEKLLNRKASVRDMFKVVADRYGYKPTTDSKTDVSDIGDGPKSR